MVVHIQGFAFAQELLQQQDKWHPLVLNPDNLVFHEDEEGDQQQQQQEELTTIVLLLLQDDEDTL